MDKPQFKIHGSKRRIAKKNRNMLRSMINSFHKDRQIAKDMCDIYGGYVVSDAKADYHLTMMKKELRELELKLSERHER